MARNVFYKSIKNHLQCKARLQNYLNGIAETGLTPETICTPANCELGTWLQSEGEAYNHIPGYYHLEEVHAELHWHATEIVRLYDRGDRVSAKEMYELNYFILSRNLVQLLTMFNHKSREQDVAAAEMLPGAASIQYR